MGGGNRGARGSARSDGTRADRRLARGSATRSSIVQATLELIDAGVARPTVRQVARQAGVSRRLVFYYFRRVDALLLRAVESRLALQHTLIAPLPPACPVEIRIQAVCRQRRELFEALGTVYQAAALVDEGPAARGPGLPAHLEDLRYQLAVTFAPELERHGRDGPMVLIRMDLVTSWESWRVLRTRDGLSASAAERSIALLVSGALWPRPVGQVSAG